MRIMQLARFGVVGAVATGIYFLVAVGFGQLAANLHPVLAHTVAVIVSTIASYLGHHKFTFQANQQHFYYGARFLLTAAGLYSITTLLVIVANALRPSHQVLISAAITLCFPMISYMLNSHWTFAGSKGRRSEH
jgi:putative flippase GtrA